jgi:hypothetical protein
MSNQMCVTSLVSMIVQSNTASEISVWQGWRRSQATLKGYAPRGFADPGLARMEVATLVAPPLT